MNPTARREVVIAAADVAVVGDLRHPREARGIVVCAHASGTGRKRSRNQTMADHLAGMGLATLLLDLLTPDEDAREAAGACLRFDIDLLSERLLAATEWVQTSACTRGLALGYLGARTGAAAALQAAAVLKDRVRAVVSRGGRPDLVPPALLARVTAPTLLIAGSADPELLQRNRRAAEALRGTYHLEIVAGASHLFERPETLAQVAAHTGHWFQRYLSVGTPAALGNGHA